MEEGSRIDRCVNPEPHYILGTLYIQLPSIFSGGEMIVYSGDEREKENDEGEMARINLGGTRDGMIEIWFTSSPSIFTSLLGERASAHSKQSKTFYVTADTNIGITSS